MAALLGLLTGLLAFVPNIGAIVSGAADGRGRLFGGHRPRDCGRSTYFIVQTVDGQPDRPLRRARRTVDLAPRWCLRRSCIFGALFGFMGLFLADPIVATVKTALEDLSGGKPEASKPGQPKAGNMAAGPTALAGAQPEERHWGPPAGHGHRTTNLRLG